MAAPATPKVIFAPEELSQVKKLEQAFAEVTITNQSEFDFALEFTKHVKRLRNRYDDKLKEVLKPIDESKKQVQALFAPIIKSLDSAEKALKEGMSKFFDEVEAARLQAASTPGGAVVPAPATASVQGLQVRKLRRWRVVDESQVPRALFSVDAEKVEAALDSVEAIPGIEVYYENSLRVTAGE